MIRATLLLGRYGRRQEAPQFLGIECWSGMRAVALTLRVQSCRVRAPGPQGVLTEAWLSFFPEPGQRPALRLQS